MQQGMRIKRRYFVVTRAGFMHYFESRWGVEPLRSVSLLNCSVKKDPEDFRAFILDMNEGKGADFFEQVKKTATPMQFHLIGKSQVCIQRACLRHR